MMNNTDTRIHFKQPCKKGVAGYPQEDYLAR